MPESDLNYWKRLLSSSEYNTYGSYQIGGNEGKYGFTIMSQNFIWKQQVNVVMPEMEKNIVFSTTEMSRSHYLPFVNYHSGLDAYFMLYITWGEKDGRHKSYVMPGMGSDTHSISEMSKTLFQSFHPHNGFLPPDWYSQLFKNRQYIAIIPEMVPGYTLSSEGSSKQCMFLST